MYSLLEVFGPVIQGEGSRMGRPAIFLRFAGCDYDCAWCDTATTMQQAPQQLSQEDLLGEIDQRASKFSRLDIVLTGGNPCLQSDLQPLLDELLARWAYITVETQGTVCPPWLRDVDWVVVAPKLPSSGMWESTQKDFLAFFQQYRQLLSTHRGWELKLVLSKNHPEDWLAAIELLRELDTQHKRSGLHAVTITPVTPVGSDAQQAYADLINFDCWDADAVARMATVTRLAGGATIRFLPQLHQIMGVR